MTAVGQLKEFNPASASFEVYVERFELYVSANNIPEDKKSQLFLTAIGDEAYTTLRSILLDKAPKEATYKDIVSHLQKHYGPKRSVVAERYQFQKRNQKCDESISDFIVALKSLAMPCKFGAFQKEALRDRFIAGVSSDSVRCRLLALDDDEATFDKVCQVACSMEAAERQTREMHNLPATSNDANGGESVFSKEQRTSQKQGPLKAPVLRDDKGAVLTDTAGPYAVGDFATVVCEVKGMSHPLPEVEWLLSDGKIGAELTPLPKSAVTTRASSVDDGGESLVGSVTLVRSRARVGPLTREHLHATLTCRIQNRVWPPAQASVGIDMNLPPLSVRILRSAGGSLRAGLPVEIVCECWGSRPPATIQWWLGPSRLQQTFGHASTNGNASSSVVTFTPSSRDHGRHLRCVARNPALPKSSPEREDRWTMTVHYKPEVYLQLGTPFRGGSVQEGTDVYFECIVNSNPPTSEIQWFKDGVTDLTTYRGSSDGSDVVVASGRFLALQKLTKALSGHYSCSATNAEGTTTSNAIALRVQHPPVCSHGGSVVYAASRHEPVRVTCEVYAEPRNVSFRWSFSSSSRNRDFDHFEDVDQRIITEKDENVNLIEVRRRTAMAVSELEYTPQFQSDFGTLLCIAQNAIGTQKEPCTFHIMQAGPPEPLEGCTVSNLTERGFSIECRGDGTLRRHSSSMNAVSNSSKGQDAVFYVLEVYGPPVGSSLQHGVSSSRQQVLVRNISGPEPWFHVGRVSSGTEYEVRIFAANGKGRSRPVTLSACTLPPAEALLEKVPAWTAHFHLLHWLLVAAAVLVLAAAAAVLLFFRRKRRRVRCGESQDEKSQDGNNERWSGELTQMVPASRSGNTVTCTKDEILILDKRKNKVDI